MTAFYKNNHKANSLAGVRQDEKIGWTWKNEAGELSKSETMSLSIIGKKPKYLVMRA